MVQAVVCFADWVHDRGFLIGKPFAIFHVLLLFRDPLVCLFYIYIRIGKKHLAQVIMKMMKV